MTEHRGFFSSLALFLVISIIAASTIASLQLSSLENATNAAFEAKKVADRYHDAREFVNQTLTDALLDAAYAKHGCTITATSFCGQINSSSSNRLEEYLGWSESALSEQQVQVHLTYPYLLAYNCFEQSAPEGFNYSYEYTVNVLVRANSSNAFKEGNALFTRTISILNYTKPTINNTQTCIPAIPVKIQINGSNSIIKEYQIDCNQTPTNLGNNPCP